MVATLSLRFADSRLLGLRPWAARTNANDEPRPGNSVPDRAAGVVRYAAAAEPRRRVLLAEDDDRVRGALGELLSLAGYDVVTVPDALIARRLTGSESFGVVVSDVLMPGCTGIQFVHQLREAGDRTPVVLITGHGLSQAQLGELASHGVRCLWKPFGIADLEAAIEAVVAEAGGDTGTT